MAHARLKVTLLLVLFGAFLPRGACSQTVAHVPGKVFTRADTLRGTNGPGRSWWDAQFYDLHVSINPADSSIRGWNAISYRVLAPAREMQIDLQVPMEIDTIVQDRRPLSFGRGSNA